MSDNTNSERALFEAAWRKEYNMPESAKFSPFVAGRYLATAVDDAFQGWRMARAAIDKGARQAAPEAPTLPHITNPDALEAGREYWLRDKKTGATKIRECQVDNGCRYFEARIWAEPINNQAMERSDIFGPLPVRTFGASTGPAPEAPASEQQTKHIGYISQSSLEAMPLLKNEKYGICPAIMPNESDVGSPAIAVYVLATPAATTASASTKTVRSLTKAQIDEIVYSCRQNGNDTTYDIVNAAIAHIDGRTAGTGTETGKS